MIRNVRDEARSNDMTDEFSSELGRQADAIANRFARSYLDGVSDGQSPSLQDYLDASPSAEIREKIQQIVNFDSLVELTEEIL